MVHPHNPRVNARKLSLFSFYQTLCLCYLKDEKETDGHISSVISFQRIIKGFLSLLPDGDKYLEHIIYMNEQFFSYKHQSRVDISYCKTIREGVRLYAQNFYHEINPCMRSLSLDYIDRIEQALFLLGYVEYKTLKTSKGILINEFVELAKRYGDTTSPKLINAVFEKWMSTIS